MKQRFAFVFLTLFQLGLALPLLTAEPLPENIADASQSLIISSPDHFFQNSRRLVEAKNHPLPNTGPGEILARGIVLEPEVSDIRLEADYVLSSQFLSPGDPAHGAINNVYGVPTWVVPRENALAILSLIEAAETTGDSAYLERAELAANYLLRVQDKSDGGWFDQYDHATPVVQSKSPTQTAEVLMALDKLGYTAARYGAMKRGAHYLLACQKPSNKGGQNDGLLGGGKDAAGNFSNWRWASDNSFAYLALKAVERWATVREDNAFAFTVRRAAERVLNGINVYLYNANPADDDFGVWKRAIDGAGVEQEPWFHEWINYAPQMLDLPAIGVGNPRVGEWIHTQFQKEDGAVVWNDTWHTARKSPGFSFQAALVWYDLGQTVYADAAVHWATSSGLWQKNPDSNSISGGWIDWSEPAEQAPFWQRFIDTSFYATAAFKGSYDFRSELNAAEILRMKLQNSDARRNDFNLLFGTHIPTHGKLTSFDDAFLEGLTQNPSYQAKAFEQTLPKAASLLRYLQGHPGRLADTHLLFGTTLPEAGSPDAGGLGMLFDTTGTPGYSQPLFVSGLAKAASLYRALQYATGRRNRFNLLFGIGVPASGSPGVSLRTQLFNMTGDPSYGQSAFLIGLNKSARLYRALLANNAKRLSFNDFFSASLPPTGSPNTQDRTLLFDLTGDPAYDFTDLMYFL